MAESNSRSCSVSDDVLKRHLLALSFPFSAEISTSDTFQVQRTVCWLEDTIIRRQEIDARNILRSRKNFRHALARYLTDLRAPPKIVDDCNMQAALTWIIRVALAERFRDDPHKFNQFVDPWDGRSVPVVKGASNDERLAATAKRMVLDIGVADVPVPSTDAALRGVAALVQARLSSKQNVLGPLDVMDVEREDPHCGRKQTAAKEADRETHSVLDLEQLPLGFKTSDSNVDRIAKVLRLLYVRKLRSLQNDINQAIATMQRVTADPKTDSRLGQVGR